MTSSDPSPAPARPDACGATPDHHALIINSIIQGFCVVEMIFDAFGQAIDYRFLEINQAFVQQTGLTDVVGRRMRELAPAHESYWFETYGRVAQTGQPAAALVDIGLPGIDGYEVARRLRRDPATRSIRLIALTGYGLAEDQRRVLEAGFDQHLVKPVSIDQLLEALAPTGVQAEDAA